MQETANILISDFIRQMPKVELHAHLNGSISPKTVEKLIQLKKTKCGDCLTFNAASPNDLEQCFKLFQVIHTVTDSPEAIYMAACDVIKDFYSDGVCHLELRTTPREVPNCMTQESYVRTVLKAIEDVRTSNSCPNMSVKLLLSIDRARSFEEAENTVKIAEQMSSDITGVDLSGNPNKNDISCFIPILEYAKKKGLKLALHVAEVPNDKEALQLLKLQPHRIGHGTFLHPKKGGSEDNFSFLLESKIPLEICLTSNVTAKTVPSYETHHYPLFREINYPCALCTDDKGIFNNSLSMEYAIAQKYYSLTDNELWELSASAVNYSFASPEEKNELKQLWKR